MKKVLLLAFTALLTVSMIFAQATDEKVSSFPTKNIDWVVPIGAGQPVDRHVRALDNIIDFGTTTSITNMAGGGQAIGITEVLNRPADGYSIASSAFAGFITTPATTETEYSVADFRHIAAMNAPSYSVILVAPGSKIDSWDTLKKMLQSGEKIYYSASNLGGVGHLAFLSIMQQLGATNAEYVTFNGAAESCTALMGNHIDLAIIDAAVAKSYTDAGTLVNILSVAQQKLDLYPNTICAGEVGLEGMNSFAGFMWLAVKKDTPEDVVNFLKEKIYAAIESDEYQEYLKKESEILKSGYKEEDITPVILHAAESFKELTSMLQ